MVTSAVRLDTRRPTAIAVLAMGGQGGGVLVDWIVALAESQGHVAQATSVPGVAQRTGATIYYVETIAPDDSGRRPVLSLMPVPGEVDIVIGAELMEAGRAIQRGLVTPDRTTLIASSHRAYAVSEKVVPGDGAGDPAKVFEAAQAASKQFLAFDMATIAEETESVVSAALFGALAASGALPYPRAAYEATIRATGLGVEASLRAFDRAHEAAENERRTPTAPPARPTGGSVKKKLPALGPVGDAWFDTLVERARKLPAAAHGMVAAGLARVVDFQDVAYGREYLDRVEAFAAIERQSASPANAMFPLTCAAAKHIARAMAYDDVIRVADLKTRGSRFERVRNEIALRPGQIAYTTEFMHPRMEEVCGTLPAGIGLWLESSPRMLGVLRRFVDRGRRVQTGTIGWFLPLYFLAGWRRFRRGTLRHRREAAHIVAWLDQAATAAKRDIALGVELLEARRLVKGYSDTHDAGAGRFSQLMTMARRLEGRADAADWVRRLRQSALADAGGRAFADTIKTVESFL
ncbi:MAG: indolepyruvate oxidoreductase subunit beta family protein [Reyranella sp.]|uniref:indolepyruvate oxidoreductase subunit beta family protein n=1 Tax=Reyranella sp. TaxID=1929291 RepID=UPI003D129A08